MSAKGFSSFPFDERKSVQVAARLVHQSGGEMNYMALMKLMVLIDRKSLLKFGRPVTGDKVSAMKDGLVLSRILDFVSQKKQDHPPSFWHQFIPRPAPYIYTVKFGGVPETSALSEAELALIDDVYAEHRDKTEWELSDFHHQLPEWKESNCGKSSVDVPFSRIMQLENVPDSEIAAVQNEANADRSLDILLAKAAR